MNIFKKLITLTLLSLSLLSCDDKSKSMPKKQEEVYDFRNEKYQDFYSKFAREVDRRSDLNAHVTNFGFEKHFDKAYIKAVLGLDVEEDFYFKLHVDRIDPIKNKEYNLGGGDFFSKPEDVINRYDDLYSRGDKHFEYELCDDIYHKKGLFCIRDLYFDKIKYYYFPNSEKINYVDKNLDFSCESFYTENQRCELWHYTDKPYNLRIVIKFPNREEFFRIVEYTDRYIYQITGEHIWQNLPQES